MLPLVTPVKPGARSQSRPQEEMPSLFGGHVGIDLEHCRKTGLRRPPAEKRARIRLVGNEPTQASKRYRADHADHSPQNQKPDHQHIVDERIIAYPQHTTVERRATTKNAAQLQSQSTAPILNTTIIMR